MQKEIGKYSTFDAFEHVEDVGQKSVPIRWVVSISKQALDGENQPIKAYVLGCPGFAKKLNNILSKIY